MTEKTTQITKRPVSETILFQALLGIAFIWFFTVAVLRRLTFQRANDEKPGDSCYRSAQRSAYSVVPYAFMRI